MSLVKSPAIIIKKKFTARFSSPEINHGTRISPEELYKSGYHRLPTKSHSLAFSPETLKAIVEPR